MSLPKNVFYETVLQAVSRVRISDYNLSRSQKWASVSTKCAIRCPLPDNIFLLLTGLLILYATDNLSYWCKFLLVSYMSVVSFSDFYVFTVNYVI